MKRKKILIICLIIIIMGIIILLYNKYWQKENGVLYKLTYYDELIPGSTSDITILENNVKIKTTKSCSLVDCEEKEPEYKTYNYSKKNIDKLTNFIKKNFSANNTIELYHTQLNERQKEIISGIILGEYFFETSIEEYKYKIEYTKNENLNYIIYFKDNTSILVKKLIINNDYDIVKIDTYSLDFSKDNLSIISNYIKNEVKKENSNIIYKDSTLKKDEINIFNSIIENNEVYLNNINNEAKLLYTISYNGINCPTPTLYLYSDNTYEYYYTFSTGDEELTPKTGTYDYDVTKIINNIDKYEENQMGPYIIKDSDNNEYVTYNTNTELQELLKSLNVTLEKCLE